MKSLSLRSFVRGRESEMGKKGNISGCESCSHRTDGGESELEMSEAEEGRIIALMVVDTRPRKLW